MIYTVSMEPVCPVCHVTVRPTDFYCYNCGKNLHEKPMSVTTEYLYYAGSLLLPPLGIFWGLKMLSGDERARRIGIVCIALTVVSTIAATVWTMRLFQGINAQVNQQLQGIGGL